MFEADYIMKQLSLGVEVKSMEPLDWKPYQYPESIKFLQTDRFENKNSEGFARTWFVIKSVKINKVKTEYDTYIEIEDIKLGVNACTRELNA